MSTGTQRLEEWEKRRQERFELMLQYAKRRWTRGNPRTWRGRKRKVG